MPALPALSQFRLDVRDSGVAHLLFDCPGRTMNVFSEAAIEDIGRVAAWLVTADVRGLVISSGKASAFCAGADLNELGAASDMIVTAPAPVRFSRAYDHFSRLGLALRALETAGKPVAAAIAGLALGGGCELALAAHHRVLVDDPKAALGVPESLVGLFPGAGGTQRLPRLLGIGASLPLLLEGARLSGKAALDAGLVDRLAAPGDELAAAEAWVRGAPAALQPWDREDFALPSGTGIAAELAPVRQRLLADTQGHYPAPLAILDCIEFGLPQPMEGAIRTEMAIFAALIQREEPRNMIRTLFLARTEHDRLARRGALPRALGDAVERAREIMAEPDANLRRAGFFGGDGAVVRERAMAGYWLDTPQAIDARQAVEALSRALAEMAAGLVDDELALFDHLTVRDLGYPAYLGGPIAWTQRVRGAG